MCKDILKLNYFSTREHIKFWWEANTAHGIHSPFIYDMVSNCLRNPKIIIKTRFYTESIPRKYLILLNRILNYYNLKNITTNYNHNFESLISQNFNNREIILEKLEENQFWFILNIRKNELMLKQWKEIINDGRIDVSIDLFQFGILLKRKEQVKENFKLKSKF